MSVLHIISGLGIGGAETMLVQLASRLQGRGLQQHVVSLTGPGPRLSELESRGIPVTCLRLRWTPGAVFEFLAIVALVRRLRPKVIQGWMYHGDLVAALAHRLAPRRSQRRLFWGLRASNMDDARYRNLVNWSARLSAWPDTIVANSAVGAKFHIARGYRARRIEIIPNGIDIRKFRPDSMLRQKLRAELGISASAIIAIHVARVDPMKDHATCLAALSALPNVSGLLVGRGTDTLTLPANVRSLGERADAAALYAASDIVLSTSAYGEGFSNAIAEGMSAGLVPIAADVGDMRSIIGETGAVISPGNVPALAEAICNEAKRPPGERTKRGLAARDRVVRLYSLDHMVDRFARLYDASEVDGAV